MSEEVTQETNIVLVKVPEKNKIGFCNDWTRTATILTVAQLLSKQPLTDPAWQLESLYTMIGLWVYQLLINRLDMSKIFPGHHELVNDLIKTFVIITVSNFLKSWSKGQPTFTRDFWTKMILVLFGVFFYHLVIQKTLRNFIQKNMTNNNAVDADLIEDWVETSVIFAISQQFGGGSLTDRQWLKETFFNLIGLTMYHLMIKPLC